MRNAGFFALFLVACAGEVPPQPSGGSDSGVAALDCTTYCGRVMTNCTGANQQYAAMDTCMASCPHFPAGAIADTSGNTLGCRIYHAGNAAMDPATHCLHAGPAGGGHCGMPCEGFCSLVVAECATEYPTAGDCATQCAGYAADPAYAFSVSTGNNLSCRIHHATNASTDPTTHCPHTGSASPVCI